MLEKGQQVSVYKIKEILSTEITHISCLTEDPFFHAPVLLKIYPVDFLEDKKQRKHLGKQLEKLLLLEHPSIAPVFDSGFEGEYFYYTTNYNYQAPLLERVSEGLSSELILKIVRDLGRGLEHAVDRGLEHGHLTAADIYFGDDDQAIIADFGIDYCFKSFIENQPLEWSEEQALQDLGRFQLQLLRPSSRDNTGRELELLSGIENEQLRKVTERFFTEKQDHYRSFSELIDALDPLMEKPPVETRPMVQQKSMAVCTKTGITDQQREQVLPHVRQLISEKNRYKSLLDKALLEQNKVSDQLKQTLLELDQAAQLQLMAPESPVSGNRKKAVGWVFAGFLFGVILSGSYGFSLQQKNVDQVSPSNDEKPIVKVQTELKGLPVVVKQTNVLKSPLISEELPAKESTPVAEVKKERELFSGEQEKKVKPTPVVAEQSQQWWPAGQEFSAVVTRQKPVKLSSATATDTVYTELSLAEREVIIQDLSHWVDSWSEQNPAAYLSHYSEQYRPELGKSREEWLLTRQARLHRPDWIRVNIQDIKMHRLAEDRVQVKFKQNYRSNSYQDQIWKSLNLVQESGGWQILTERSLGKVDLVASR